MELYKEGYTQNRELSWLNYNERVLQEALDVTVPLFERLNYISIFMSNLEEFIQVRVGGLIEEDERGSDKIDDKSGMNAEEQLKAIYKRIAQLLTYKDKIHVRVEQRLAKAGIVRVDSKSLTREEVDKCKKFYKKEVKNTIKIYMGSKVKDFPYIDQDKSYIVSRLEAETNIIFSVIDIPSNLPKILVLNDGIPASLSLQYDFNAYSNARYGSTTFRYILVEDIIKMFAADVFAPFDVAEIATIDIARNAEIEIDKKEGDMLKDMKELSEQRRYSSPDKLIIDTNISENLNKFLMKVFKLKRAQVFTTLKFDYSYVGELEEKIPGWLKDELCWGPVKGFNQLKLGYGPVIDRLRKKEILCCYPYDTMEPFLELLKECTTDPRVKEIRMTIYRLSSHPKIVEYLEEAAQNGKKVTAVMELRARFDEENNIDWSERMRRKGVKIRFGDERYKIHSKLAQIVLEESGKTKYITHLSTGNFNEKTASRYTDIALITYDQRIGAAANEMWQDIMANKVGSYDHILTSPKTMKETLINLIRREAKKGKNGRIFIKVNSVTDDDLIEELKQASCAGCRIRMIVRGICCLLPGVEGYTENIKVVNVVGRYLEHSRVYVFGTGKEEVMYISSADFMVRNMSKRIELAAPIYNNELRRRIKAILYLNYMDNVKGRYLRYDGKYYKKVQGDKVVDSQTMLMG